MKGIKTAAATALAIALLPYVSQAALLASPFGGKIAVYIPAVGCTQLTTALATLTLGTITATVDKLTIIDSTNRQQRTLGFLNINVFGIPIPIMILLGLTRLYSYYNYPTPQTWVLGDAWSVDGLCDGALGKMVGGTVCKTITETLQKTCSITEVVRQIGTGIGPSTSQNGLGGSK